MTADKFIIDLALLALVIAAVFTTGATIQIIAYRRDGIPTWQRLRATYTMRRWLTNPYKTCVVAMVWQTNFQQIAITGPINTFADELDYRSRLYLVLANLIGAAICFYALHLRDFEQSLWIEAWAYIAMIGTLALWILLVYLTIPLPNTGYGLNLAEAVVIASTIRLPLILRYKRLLHATHDNPTEPNVTKLARLRLILGGITITSEQASS